MGLTILVPEFFVDYAGQVSYGELAIDDGKIIAVGDLSHLSAPRHRLAGQVIVPGFVNAHSHAFQRLLRGVVERQTLTHLDNFFSWREKMYALAKKLSAEQLGLIAEFTFMEMIEAGFTHVAEFHYLHHNHHRDGQYDPLIMSTSLVQAAARAGINLCLLETAYHRAGFMMPILPEQKRFAFESVNEFLELAQKARQALQSFGTTIGLAIHSVRAVPENWFMPIHEMAQVHGLPLHVHASEQQAEVQACLRHTGLSPIALLHHYGLLTPRTTLVHATHLIDNDAELIADQRSLVCICPSTEKNLGDGVIPLSDLFVRGVDLCVGTDQHVRIDAFDEVRSLEELERLRLCRRGVLMKKPGHIYPTFLHSLTTAGMRSFAPEFSSSSLVGQAANLIAIELPCEYEWHGAEVALEAIFLAANASKITTVMSKGKILVQESRLVSEEKSRLRREIGSFFKQ